jgi:hypothetical protein
MSFPAIQGERQQLLSGLQVSSFELQEISADEIGISHGGHLRLQIRKVTDFLGGLLLYLPQLLS